MRAASSPFRTGMLMSRTIRFCVSSTHWSIASCPLTPSPHTRQPASASSNERIMPRMRSLSPDANSAPGRSERFVYKHSSIFHDPLHVVEDHLDIGQRIAFHGY